MPGVSVIEMLVPDIVAFVQDGGGKTLRCGRPDVTTQYRVPY